MSPIFYESLNGTHRYDVTINNLGKLLWRQNETQNLNKNWFDTRNYDKTPNKSLEFITV